MGAGVAARRVGRDAAGRCAGPAGLSTIKLSRDNEDVGVTPRRAGARGGRVRGASYAPWDGLLLILALTICQGGRPRRAPPPPRDARAGVASSGARVKAVFFKRLPAPRAPSGGPRDLYRQPRVPGPPPAAGTPPLSTFCPPFYRIIASSRSPRDGAAHYAYIRWAERSQ